MSNKTDFLLLMLKFNIPVSNEVRVGSTGYLDKPVTDKLYTGVDPHDRVFVNIPIIATRSYHGDAETKNTAFTVFQRYTSDDMIFVLGCHLAPMQRENFLLDEKGCMDLSNLSKLLAGETLKFFADRYHEDVLVTDENNWIEITLQK